MPKSDIQTYDKNWMSLSDSDEKITRLLVGTTQDQTTLTSRGKIPCQPSALRGNMYEQKLPKGGLCTLSRGVSNGQTHLSWLYGSSCPYLDNTIHVSANFQSEYWSCQWWVK